ncbi:sulfatase-like hydrolase/transferase [Paenibacillus sp. IB182496]|uniref:Sulfatase-like hydrolase/transferase n=1 Tax=Paenibacillus sabuli TaxID=2772509 RepID=A0A927BQ99_9BACL|nr:sulfatase-like hydrolase/transferase [Paenibacillus sabuli]MBD2843574.1 sulfatase-like hydrolase/transferase [Paenibacillus sabuli]
MVGKERPNVLIFMTDQQQASVTEAGHPCRLPNLDRIAAEGVRFNRAYPPMAHCCPARASMMTGLYPSQHGMYNNCLNDQAVNRSLNDGVETFSEKLKDAGYDLYFSGKWHVSATENPVERGWKELFVGAPKGAIMGTRRQRYQVDHEKYKAEQRRERQRGELARPGWGHVKLYGASEMAYEELRDYEAVKRGIAQLDQLKSSCDPWCMYIGVTGPHDPFIIPEKYASMYEPKSIPLPPNYHDDLADKPGVYRKIRKVFQPFGDDEVRESIAHYWGYCTMMDDMFGEVLDTLEQNGQLDDTLILFLSDHGEHAGAHGLYCKGISMFEEGYRVPMIIRWPGGVSNPGRSCDAFVTLMDIAPTLLEAAGAKELPRCAGRSLRPFLEDAGPPNDWRDSVYAQCNGVEVFYTSRMVRTDRYKFVFHATDINELYDLEADPHEMRNIIDLPEMADVVERMYGKMWAHAFESEDTIFNPYVTVATADLGPGLFGGSESNS